MPVRVPPPSTAPAMPPSIPPAMQMPHPQAIQGPPGPQGPPGLSGASTETLEQRIYDLLAPFRGLDLEGDSEGEFDLPSRKDEIKALILCENIAFLIRHNQGSYGKRIEPTDVSFATKNWAARTTGQGIVGMAVFVNGNAFSHTVVRVMLEKDDDVVDKLAEQAEERLQQFFPGV